MQKPWLKNDAITGLPIIIISVVYFVVRSTIVQTLLEQLVVPDLPDIELPKKVCEAFSELARRDSEKFHFSKGPVRYPLP